MMKIIFIEFLSKKNVLIITILKINLFLVFEISYRTKPHLITEKPEKLAKIVFETIL